MRASSNIFPHAFVVASDNDDVPSPETASAYRRRARQLRGRLRHDPVALHLSLKKLAIETDGAAPTPGSMRHSVAPARRVISREVAPDGDVEPSSTSQPDVAFENRSAAASPAFAGETVAYGLNVPTEAVDRFASRVRAMLAEGILRYDQRQKLMREAAGLGLGKFEASLLIAAVEHRHRSTHPVAPPIRRGSVAATVVGVLLIEIAALSAWILFW